ncbi:MAG: hypothetical protein JKY98_11175 [Gammaproteobacteria bacterium]|nr:hypothetical protein [Gammaproteobacteria bacterium]
MIFASGHSIFWRLTDETGQGSDVVSIVLANQKEDEAAEVEIETDIISAPHETDPPDHPIEIEWNKKDLNLFLTLLRNTFPPRKILEQDEQIELDLTDESVLRIMHIVASARFSTPYPVETVINPDRSLPSEMVRFRVGEHISLDTIDGFKPGVIVAVNDDEINCVLLEEITSPAGDNIQLDRHDLIVLNKQFALPSIFTVNQPGESDLIH